ncbi:ABC transporter ATP-binding protein [Microbulbifer sediminum]|uniref:ABC transporter ATP-binding protein n=1 Tax=Microbulbifer sediminum TaxID=2904250 RepID=UPI001F1B3223|nr:ABC transporter ATP-binding protein [Microbulbifer sediminum]
MRNSTLVVSCHGLAVERRRERVIEGFSCRLQPGELTAVVGPNGAGKSSLLQALAGVLSPAAGRIDFGELDSAAIPVARRAQLCAYLPQAEVPAWSLAVRDFVALGLLPWGKRVDRQRRVAAALRQVDARGFSERPVTQLSGGELRRVQLARLLVGEAPFLVADEPTAALDIRHQLQLMQNFRRQADSGRTVVLALHDLALAARYCDRILLLERGRLRAEGVPADVLKPELIGEVYGISCELRWRDGVADFVPLDLL